MSETILVGIFTLVGTAVGSLVTAWVGIEQTKQADIMAKKSELRQLRQLLYTELITNLTKLPQNPIEGESSFAALEIAKDFMITNQARINLYSSTKVLDQTRDFIEFMRDLTMNGGFAGSSLQMKDKRVTLINSMRAEIGVED